MFKGSQFKPPFLVTIIFTSTTTEENHPICSGFALISPSPGCRISCIQSTVN